MNTLLRAPRSLLLGLLGLLLASCSLLQAAPQIGLLTDTNGAVIRSGFWSTNSAAISNAVGLAQFGKATNGTLRGVTLAGGVVLDGFADGVPILEDGDGTLTVVTEVSPTELRYLDGVTAGLQAQLNAKSPGLSFPTNYFTVSASTNVTLKAHGVSSLVNVTAGDLQDLASFGVFDSSYPTRIRVLRDDNGYILGSGRWFNKDATDTRISDGITIILPIDVPSDASPGRWVLEGYEQ